MWLVWQFLYGNDLPNEWWGTNVNDYLRGYGGNDTLIGGAGTDVYRFGSGNNELDGNDVIQGNANDILFLRNTDTPYDFDHIRQNHS